jgi:hypothetical protein
MILTGENRSTRGKTCPSATLSTTNPTYTDPGSNPGLRGGRPAANRLSHGTAVRRPYLNHCLQRIIKQTLVFEIICFMDFELPHVLRKRYVSRTGPVPVLWRNMRPTSTQLGQVRKAIPNQFLTRDGRKRVKINNSSYDGNSPLESYRTAVLHVTLRERTQIIQVTRTYYSKYRESLNVRYDYNPSKNMRHIHLLI